MNPLNAVDVAKTAMMEVLEKSQVIAIDEALLAAMKGGNDNHGSVYIDFCVFSKVECSLFSYCVIGHDDHLIWTSLSLEGLVEQI